MVDAATVAAIGTAATAIATNVITALKQNSRIKYLEQWVCTRQPCKDRITTDKPTNQS